MSSRREEKERLRAQRLAEERASASHGQRRLYLGYAVAGALALAIVVGLVVVIASGGSGGGSGSACSEAKIQEVGSFKGLEPDCRKGTTPPPLRYGDLPVSAQKAGCQLKLNLPDEGSTHIPDSSAFEYKTVPPTSGNHNPVPTSDGAFQSPIPSSTSSSPNFRNTTHSLEHGRVAIEYKPSLPQSDQLALKGVFDADPDGLILFPNPNIPYDVAVTAWTNEAICPKYNPVILDLIRNFRDTYRGNGPEQGIPIHL